MANWVAANRPKNTDNAFSVHYLFNTKWMNQGAFFQIVAPCKRIRNPAHFCCWNPEFRGLGSGIHNGLESGIHYGLEYGIHRNLDFSELRQLIISFSFTSHYQECQKRNKAKHSVAGFCLVTYYPAKTTASHRAAGFRPTLDLAASRNLCFHSLNPNTSMRDSQSKQN